MARTNETIDELECLYETCQACPFNSPSGCNPPADVDLESISQIFEWIKDFWRDGNGMLSDETVLDCLTMCTDGYDFQPDFDDYEEYAENGMPEISDEMKPVLINILKAETDKMIVDIKNRIGKEV